MNLLAGGYTFNKRWCLGVIIASVWLLPVEVLWAQGTIRHHPPSYAERGEDVRLIFEAPGINDSEVLEALFFYRLGGSGSFTQQEVVFQNGRAEIPFTIDDESVLFVEYYFAIRTTSGRQYLYPDIVSDEPPVTVEIVSPRVESYMQTDKVDAAVLSPAEGDAVAREDFLLTAALFYDEGAISGSFKLHINGRDVTEIAEISPFLIKFRDGDMGSGDQTVQILLEEDGTTYEVERWQFRVVKTAVVGREMTVSGLDATFGGDVELGASSHFISGSSTDQLTGRLNARGQKGKLQYSMRGYLTTQESSRLQPQNRYYVDLNYDRQYFLRIGDTSPSFSDYTIRGRRLRGLHGGLSLFDKRLQFEVASGILQRSVSNLFNPIEVEERDSGNGVEELFFLNLEQDGSGSYQRKVTGGRLAIGNREKFQFAFNALRIRDDSTSVTRIRNFRDVIEDRPDLHQQLSVQQFNYLQQNPDELQVTSTLPSPKDNLVVGTEIDFTADQQRFRFHTEFSASLLNEDISPGALDRQQADELGIDLDGNLENLFSNLSWLIIINERMSTLPFKYRELDDGTTEIDLFFPSSILASETRVEYLYGGHRLRADYRWVGPDYRSLANSTIRRDVSGISITDRFRMADNRLVFSMGGELLRDNVNNYKSSTLKTGTGRVSVGWYPFRFDLPRVNAGFRYRKRGNDIDRYNPYVGENLEKSAVRNYAISEGDTVQTSTPRSDALFSLNTSVTQQFSLVNAQHEAGISYSLSDLKSEVNEYGDYRNNSISFSLQSRFDGLPFQSRIAWNSTNSKAVSGLNEAKIRSFDVGLNWALMDNGLILNSTFSFARSRFENLPLIVQNGVLHGNRDQIFIPSSDDLELTKTNTYMIRLSAEYAVYSTGSLQALVHYSNINRRGSNFVAVPNDRIMQLRYVHRF